MNTPKFAPQHIEAMTATPIAITYEPDARLLGRLGSVAMVELTVFIGRANMAGGAKTANGIRLQSHSDACEIPLVRHPGMSIIGSPV